MLQTRLIKSPSSYEVFLVKERSSNSLQESDQRLGKTLSLGEPGAQRDCKKSSH